MSFFKTLAIIALVTVFAAAGAMKIQDPASTGKQIMSGHLPWLLEKQIQVNKYVPGFKFTQKEATLMAQATGGAMVTCSLMMIINLGRRFFAFMLGLLLVAITVFQHVNLPNPKATPLGEQIQCMKNLAIFGGLMYVAFTNEAAEYRGSYNNVSSSRSSTNKVKTA